MLLNPVVGGGGWRRYSVDTSHWAGHVPWRGFEAVGRLSRRVCLDGGSGLWLHTMVADALAVDPTGWGGINLAMDCPAGMHPVACLWKAFKLSLCSVDPGGASHYLSSVFPLKLGELVTAGFATPLAYFKARVLRILDAVASAMRPGCCGFDPVTALATAPSHAALAFPLLHVPQQAAAAWAAADGAGHGAAAWGIDLRQPWPAPCQATCMPWHVASPSVDHLGAAADQNALDGLRQETAACVVRLGVARDALDSATAALAHAQLQVAHGQAYTGTVLVASTARRAARATVVNEQTQLEHLLTVRLHGRPVWLHRHHQSKEHARLAVALGTKWKRSALSVDVHRLVLWASYGPPEVSSPADLLPRLRPGRSLFVLHQCGDEACFSPQHLVS
jgi:hypothetical protein